MSTLPSAPDQRDARAAWTRDAWVGADAMVPIADGRHVRYVNLDHAATTPAFVSVRDTVDDFLGWYSSVHRGAGLKSRLSTEVYEACRVAVGAFLGADPAHDRVVFTRSTTESLNLVARVIGLEPDDIVAVSSIEHHSNQLPWRRVAQVAWVDTDAGGRLDLAGLERILADGGGRVRLVALTGASNVTGTMPPIRSAARLAHRHGARICVDAAQLVAHRAIDMHPADDAERLDFVAFSGHKLYAPYGAGVLAGPRDVLDRAEPMLVGGGTVASVDRDGYRLVTSVGRHEAGSPNAVGAVAIAAAIAELRRIGFGAIERHEHELVAGALRGLAALPRVRVLGDPAADARDRGAVISFTIDGIAHSTVTSALSAEWGIGARDGGFCAHPYLADLLQAAGGELHESLPSDERCSIDGAVRVSFGLPNDHEDLRRFLDAMGAICDGRLQLRYRLDRQSDRMEPVGWAPDLGALFRLPG